MKYSLLVLPFLASLAVAQDEKRDTAQSPQTVQPTGQRNRFANVRRQLNGPDPFDPLHDDTSSFVTRPRRLCGRGGDFVVPPHFATQFVKKRRLG